MSEHILSALAHLANAKRLFEKVRDNERVSSPSDVIMRQCVWMMSRSG